MEIPKTLREDYTDTPASWPWASYFNRRFPIFIDRQDRSLRVPFDHLFIARIHRILLHPTHQYIPLMGESQASSSGEPWSSSVGPGSGGGSNWLGGRDNRRRSPSPKGRTVVFPMSRTRRTSRVLDRRGGKRCRFVSLQQSHTSLPRQQPQSATYDWEGPGTARSLEWLGQLQTQASPGHLAGDRPRDTTMIEVKDLRTWLRREPALDLVARTSGRNLSSLPS